MKKVRLVWLPQAEKDLMPLPEKIQEEIFSKIDLLEEFPLMGTKMHGAYEGFRFLRGGPYLIIYRVKSETRLEISQILHGRRQRTLRVITGDLAL